MALGAAREAALGAALTIEAGRVRLWDSGELSTDPSPVAAEEPALRVIFFTCNYMYSSMDYMKETLVYM